MDERQRLNGRINSRCVGVVHVLFTEDSRQIEYFPLLCLAKYICVLIKACMCVCVRVHRTHLVVVIPEPDADGAAASGQHSCHGVEVDQHICYSLQDELFVH